MDIDKLIQQRRKRGIAKRFGSLMDIDKLIRFQCHLAQYLCFGSLMDIDKLIPQRTAVRLSYVLVL